MCIRDRPYHFAIRHRNHLDIISNFSLAAASTMTYDFTNNIASALGSQQQKLSIDGQALMISGDFNQDGIIQTTDFDLWSANPAAVNIYENTDANLDGVIQVTDFDLWFFNRAKVGNIELGF